MFRLEPPKRFSFRAEEWCEWIKEFERFRSASELSSKAGEVQRDTLLYCMGPESEKIFRSLVFTTTGEGDRRMEERDTDFETLKRKLDEYFIVKKNVIYERSQFQRRNQAEDETVEEFYRSLRDLSKHCEYADVEDQIRDRLVVGLKDRKLQERLQLTSNLTLTKALEMARQNEQVKAQMNGTKQAADVDDMKKKGGRGSRGNQQPVQSDGRHRAVSSHSQAGRGRGRKGATPQPCDRCGRSHPEGQCPARGKVCHGCKKKNHFSRMCRRAQEVAADAVSTDSDSEQFTLDAVTTIDDREGGKPWMVTLRVKDTDLRFKIDSGADCTIISEKTFRGLKRKPTLSKSTAVLTSPGGREPVKGDPDNT